MPTEDLMRFFAPKNEVRFVAFNEYKALVGPARAKQLISFFTELGVRSQPRIIRKDDYGYYRKESESFIDGLLEFLNLVEQVNDVDASVPYPARALPHRAVHLSPPSCP